MKAPSQHARPDADRHPEVLAPAGSRESLVAALRAGADAVYLGLDEGFNARARAENFALDNLSEVAEVVHRAGARLYVTLNTLAFEPELSRLESVIREVGRRGADAIIVQDIAVALIAREVAPSLHVHASTQMTVTTGEAATFAAALGVKRVVVPRELSVEEVRRYAGATGLELEVFVHGALCVSWSGQCLTSEAWSGRSANRGQCAQSCRLPYSLIVDGARRDLGDVRYLLSPKDLAGARAVPELIDAGVAGLKIEGRQKGPHYVATAVAGYRRLVDGLRRGASDEDVERALRRDLLDMTLAYSRGFGDGFLAGSDHQSLVEGRFPKHRGVYLGRVASVRGDDVWVTDDPEGRPWTGARAAGAESRGEGPNGEVSSPLASYGAPVDRSAGPAATDIDLVAGMGVVFDDGEPEDKNEAGGALFAARRDRRGWRLSFGRPGPDLRRVAPGQRVWVTSDPRARRDVDRGVKEGAPEGGVAVRLRVTGSLGEPLRVDATVLSGRSVGRAASVATEVSLQAARGPGLDAALVADKLAAFGGTAYHAAEVDVTGLSPGLHLPVSALKSARRQLVTELDRARAKVDVREASVVDALRARLLGSLPGPRRAVDAPCVVPLCRTDEQLDAAIASGCAEVELDWMELVGLKRAVERARGAGRRVTVATLRVQKPGEDEYLRAVRSLRPDGILVRHLAGLMALQDDAETVLHGDFSLNASNSLAALHLLGHGLDTLTASFDLDEAQLDAMLATVPPGRVAVVVHHRVPAFHTEHCVYAHLLSNGRDFRTCGRPCERHQVSLQDDAGRVHPVIVDAGCRNTVFNGEVQSAARVAAGLVSRGVTRFRVELVRESAAETRAVIETWQGLLSGEVEPDAALRALGAKPRLGVADAGMKLLRSS